MKYRHQSLTVLNSRSKLSHFSAPIKVTCKQCDCVILSKSSSCSEQPYVCTQLAIAICVILSKSSDNVSCYKHCDPSTEKTNTGALSEAAAGSFFFIYMKSVRYSRFFLLDSSLYTDCLLYTSPSPRD